MPLHQICIWLCLASTLCAASAKRSTRLQALAESPDDNSGNSSKSTLREALGTVASYTASGIVTGASNTASGISNFGKAAASRVTSSKKGNEQADNEEHNQLLSQKIGSGLGRVLKGTAKRTKRVAVTAGVGAKAFYQGVSEHHAKTGRDANGEFVYNVESAREEDGVAHGKATKKIRNAPQRKQSKGHQKGRNIQRRTS